MFNEDYFFNKSTLWEILLPSSGNVNGYVAHIRRKYDDLEGDNKTCRPGWEGVA